jgi:hypothetical protein
MAISEMITTFNFGKDSPQPTIVEGKLTAVDFYFLQRK